MIGVPSNGAASRTRAGRVASGLGGLALALAWPAWASAADVAPDDPWARATEVTPLERGSDGAYGRFDGGLELAVEGGWLGSVDRQHVASRLSLHHFSTAGVYLAGARQVSGGGAQQQLAFGVELKPLFLPRWSQDWERGPAWLDLAVDSLAIALGGYWASPADESPWGRRGLEASVGIAAPLQASVAGLWLALRGVGYLPDRGAGRWHPSHALLLSLQWHAMLPSPLL